MQKLETAHKSDLSPINKLTNFVISKATFQKTHHLHPSSIHIVHAKSLSVKVVDEDHATEDCPEHIMLSIPAGMQHLETETHSLEGSKCL